MIDGGIGGAERIGQILRAIPEAAEPVVQRHVKRSLVNIEGGAKRRCRVDTGRSRNSIAHEVERDGLDGTVGTNYPPAVYQHFGTGQRGQASAGALGISGVTYDASRRGMPANPFLFQAAEEERPEFVRRLAEDLERTLARVGAR